MFLVKSTSNYSKGSSYGKASRPTRSFSFPKSSGNDRSLFQNRIKVLYSQTTLYTQQVVYNF